MSSVGYAKGKEFEAVVEAKLRALAEKHPKRVTVTPQAEVKLNDGRAKVVDFAFDYGLLSSRHQVAIECQDRESWSSEILDKILAIRNHSFHNRFWFVYRDLTFLSSEVRKLLDRHGVMHFSLSELDKHLEAIRIELAVVGLLDAATVPDQFVVTGDPIVDRLIRKKDWEPPRGGGRSDPGMLSS